MIIIGVNVQWLYTCLFYSKQQLLRDQPSLGSGLFFFFLIFYLLVLWGGVAIAISKTGFCLITVDVCVLNNLYAIPCKVPTSTPNNSSCHFLVLLVAWLCLSQAIEFSGKTGHKILFQKYFYVSKPNFVHRLGTTF